MSSSVWQLDKAFHTKMVFVWLTKRNLLMDSTLSIFSVFLANSLLNRQQLNTVKYQMNNNKLRTFDGVQILLCLFLSTLCHIIDIALT